MDTLDIVTTLRNMTHKSERDLPTLEILRAINLANGILVSYLGKLVEKYVYGEIIFSDVSGDITLPEDLINIITLYRHDGSEYRKCADISIGNKPLIGKDPNFPDDPANPLFVRIGNKVTIYPTPDGSVKLEYMRMTPELIIGKGTSAADGSYLTLDEMAPMVDDILNNYYLNVYNSNYYKLSCVLITDYDGSNKKAFGSFPAGQGLIYSLVPLVPADFHWLMVDFALAFLSLAGYYEGDGAKMRKDAQDNLISILKLRGIIQ